MKVAVLDDYLDTLRTLACFRQLDGHEVAVWTDHTADLDALAARLHDTEALVLIRERTPMRGELLDAIAEPPIDQPAQRLSPHRRRGLHPPRRRRVLRHGRGHTVVRDR